MSRYDRQVPIIGEDGQHRLSASSVAVVGCGGLGTTVATMLAEAGVGRLVLIDHDVPCESNLNRQFAFREGDGRNKALALAEWVFDVNPSIIVDIVASDFREVKFECDVIVDCLDSVDARLALSDMAYFSNIPLIHAAVGSREGQLAACIPGRTPCLRCMLGYQRDADGEKPAIGAVVSAVAAMEAWEAIRLIAEGGSPIAGSLVTIDLDTYSIDSTSLIGDPSCPHCGRSAPVRDPLDVFPKTVS